MNQESKYNQGRKREKEEMWKRKRRNVEERKRRNLEERKRRNLEERENVSQSVLECHEEKIKEKS